MSAELALLALIAVVAFLLGERLWERRHANASQQALIDLVDRMAQRVQSPAAAVLEHDERVRELRTEEYAPPAVPPDDDEAFWTSRDKLAELLMAQETVNRGGD